MDSKKKKGTKVTVDSGTQSVQPSQSDMSKYARAVSNKSKINYAELKLARHEAAEADKPADKGKKAKNSPAVGSRKGKSALKSKEKKKAADSKTRKGRKTAEKNKKPAGKPETKKPEQSAGSTAEERYSNALGSGDHYSSAIEKYYLKYPDAKRKSKPASGERKQPPRKKKRRDGTAADSSGKQAKLSMAEIAVKNKQSSSVKEHARAARNARARGVISTKVANRNVYRRRKKRSGARSVLMVTLLLVFLVSVGVLVFFNIKQIRVEGDSPYSEAQIRRICTFKKGNNILFIDSDGAEQRVVRELPYVEECTVERRLPSTVVVHVKKADVLGVAQGKGSQWAVLSTEGKILESSEDKAVSVSSSADGSASTDAGASTDTGASPDAGEEPASAPVEISTAEALAAQRMVPLLTGMDLKSSDRDGFLTGESLEQVRILVVIREAFQRKEMKLTSMGFGERGYEAVYDDRILIVFGKAADAKTVHHRMDEVHTIIFDTKKISDTDKGEFAFIKNQIFFRRRYDVSEEELESISQDRRTRNQKKIYAMAEIFMSTGKDWFDGKLKTE